MTGRLTAAESVAASMLAALAAAIVCSYGLGRLGAAIAPWPVLCLSLASAAAILIWMWNRGAADGGDLASFAAVFSTVLSALLVLAWPALLPTGGGSDLTHHLQLVDFIERTWRLPHGPEAVALIGGMVNYTPGFHLLAAMAGKWTGSDGLHAVHPVIAATVALRAGLVFLIVRRVLPADRFRTPLGFAAVLLLFLPYDYFIGSFVRASFFAQAVSETFAVGLWWALVLWDEHPSARAAALFGIAGIGAFLTWPVWIGPPVLVLAAAAILRRRFERVWWRHAVLALAPIAIAVAVHSTGRLESAAILQSGGSAFEPTAARLSWTFLVLSAAGVVLAVRQRRSRVSVLLFLAIGLQASALLALENASGSATAYMARKMTHFAIYPMAVLAALALAAAWRAMVRVATASTSGPRVSTRSMELAAWAIVVAGAAAAASVCAAGPPERPSISEEMFLAGEWARANVNPTCIEYLVPEDDTSYWLHHAVLGNPVESPKGSVQPVFSYRDAVVRWITRTSRPLAIADVSVIPREVREEIDELARFGNAVVGVRRGATPCPRD